MTDLHQKFSAWAKLYMRRDLREPHADRAGEDAPRANEHQMCAMEVELRAMNAKADRSFDDAIAAIRRSDRPKS